MKLHLTAPLLLLAASLGVGCKTNATIDRNTAPEANAGADQQVAFAGAPAAVTLDGSLSIDTDGQIVKYTWVSADRGADAAVQGPLPIVTNTPFATTMLGQGQWLFHLWVEDDDGSVSEPDDVVITVGMVEAPACDPSMCMASTGMPCCTTEGTGAEPGDPVGRGPDLCGTDLGALSAALAGICLQTDQPGTPSMECPEIMSPTGAMEPGCCTDEGLCGSVSGLLGCHYPMAGPGAACTAQ